MRWRSGRFLGKLFVLNTLLVASVLAVVLYPVSLRLRSQALDEASTQLRAQAEAFRVAFLALPDEVREVGLQRLAEQWVAAQPQHLRVTIIAADGTVLAESSSDPGQMESHAGRPEVQMALREGWSDITRWSHTMSRELRYIAVRVDRPGSTPLVIRVATTTDAMNAQAQTTAKLAAAVVGGSLLAGIVLAVGLSLLWSRRITAITRAAQELARGSLSARAPVSGRDEVAGLARSLNRMADRLARQHDIDERQRRMLESLLGKLAEGVVVADPAGRVVLANTEARRLLRMRRPGCDETLAGCTVESCVSSRELQDMLRPAPSDGLQANAESNGDGAVARELRLNVGPDAEPVTVLARAFDIALPTSERGAADKPSQARVLLVSDVSEVTRTVQVKADFAANASHELRTPLAAIRAAVDTLKSVNWRTEPESVQRFVEVIARHGTRMEAMVADLLELSRLESPAADFEPEKLDPTELAEELRSAFSGGLTAKRLRFDVELPPPGRPVTANPHLLRTVLRNLVENAVQFTEAGGRVRVAIQQGEGFVVLVIEDNGCGIPREDQARVFERFYQVQRARSGHDRGTGLGLSIVRHAVAAMHGTVSLESEVGKGTLITVRIPQSAYSAKEVAIRAQDSHLRSGPARKT